MLHFSVGGWAYFSYKKLSSVALSKDQLTFHADLFVPSCHPRLPTDTQVVHSPSFTHPHRRTLNTRLIIVVDRYDGSL